MEFNWSILGWIAGIIFVYIFGLYEGRGQGYKKRKVEEEQEKKDQPARSSPASTPEIKTVTVDDPGLLRIKNENGSFALDLDGVRANPLSLSPEQRKRLIDMLSIMRPWLEGRSAPASAPSMMNASSATSARPMCEPKLRTPGTLRSSRLARLVIRVIASSDVPGFSTQCMRKSVSWNLGRNSTPICHAEPIASIRPVAKTPITRTG